MRRVASGEGKKRRAIVKICSVINRPSVLQQPFRKIYLSVYHDQTTNNRILEFERPIKSSFGSFHVEISCLLLIVIYVFKIESVLWFINNIVQTVILIYCYKSCVILLYVVQKRRQTNKSNAETTIVRLELIVLCVNLLSKRHTKGYTTIRLRDH